MNPTEGYALREGRIGDCDQLPAIEAAAAVMFRGLNVLPDDGDESNFTTPEFLEARANDGLLWVATHENRVVGFVVAWIIHGDFYVAELDVHPDHGRRGIGRALLAYICEAGFAKGYPRIVLNTFREVPWNAPFYQTAGFRIIEDPNWSEWMHPFAKQLAEEGLDLSQRCFMELLRD